MSPLARTVLYGFLIFVIPLICGRSVAFSRDSSDLASASLSPHSQYEKALSDEKGINGPPDYRKAVYWLKRSANSGYVPAEVELGALLDKGLGVARNVMLAARWYRRAARSGNLRAQTNLAWDYEHGQGVPADPEKAFFWYKKAALGGYVRAENNLATLYSRGIGVPADPATALSWYRKAAAQGYAIAQTNLGVLYANGEGVNRDPDRARFWFQKAAANGNLAAQQMLGETTAPEAVTPALPGSGRSQISDRSAVRSDPVPIYPSVDHPLVLSKRKPDDLALVIGIEHYPQGLSSAPFADNDARSVFRAMLALGIPADHLRRLSGELATQARIRSALHWLKRNAAQDSTVWVYYSGHGARSVKGSAYLVPYDADPEDLSTTGLSLNSLLAALDKLDVHRVVVVLDACFSGSGDRSVTAEGARPLMIEKPEVIVSGVRSGKLFVLSAAGPEQEAGILKPVQHGLFTYYFLRGIEGAAERNRHVHILDLYRYVRHHVSRQAALLNRSQQPELSPSGEGVNFSLR